MTRKMWLLVLAGCCACAGSGQLQRTDAHATARAPVHERDPVAKQPSKNTDDSRFESVLPVVID